MSYLRQIMQRLNARTAATTPGQAPAAAPSPLLERHLADYDAQLAACSPAMLQYEWAWIEQHLDTLTLARSTPAMLAAAGGPAHLEALLEESRRFRTLLEQRFAAAGLTPAAHRHAVVATEHAWELSPPELRRQWGF
ncbi:MAG: hypothetical protein VKK43_06200 [Synechococcaceae cyanobacterium]|nr:hypothetical protein [Synechococcaceae cyanobacterium]